MNGSLDTENTAGIESTAKATSVVSITIRAMNRGVANHRSPASLSPRFLVSLMKNLSSCIWSVTGKKRLNTFTKTFLEGSTCSSPLCQNILMPV